MYFSWLYEYLKVEVGMGKLITGSDSVDSNISRQILMFELELIIGNQVVEHVIAKS